MRWQLPQIALLALFSAAIYPCATFGASLDVTIAGCPASTHASELFTRAVSMPNAREFRFELRPGDQWLGDQQNGRDSERAEVVVSGYMPLGRRYRVSYDMMIEPGLPVSSQWVVLGQWHASEDPGDAYSSPPLSFDLDGSDLVLNTLAEPRPYHVKNPPGVERARIKNLSRGAWHTISYDVAFDPIAGSLRAKIDGAIVFDGIIPLGFNDLHGPYFKFGIYRSRARERMVARYRNIEIATIPPDNINPRGCALKVPTSSQEHR